MSIFNIKLNKNVYSVFVVNNQENKTKFLNELKSLDLKEDLKRKIKICFDYEFNSQKIGLAQVMISEKNISNNTYLFDPKEFNDLDTKFIQQKLYLNSYPKILHGCESLDIPYIYKEVLHNDINLIKQFTSTMTDTRFKCSLLGHKKCSLYEALYQTKSINQKQYDFLQNLYKQNGTIYKIHWNTHKLTLNQYMYAAFDVIFLRRLDRILNKELNKIGLDNDLIDDYSKYTMLMRNNFIDLKDVKKENLTDDKIIDLTNKIVGLRVDYLKNPTLTLIKCFIKDKDVVESILDKFKLNLIKDDLNKVIFPKVKSS